MPAPSGAVCTLKRVPGPAQRVPVPGDSSYLRLPPAPRARLPVTSQLAEKPAMPYVYNGAPLPAVTS